MGNRITTAPQDASAPRVTGYAIVDTDEASLSYNKILFLLDDEPTADEIAFELRRRDRCVEVRVLRPSYA